MRKPQDVSKALYEKGHPICEVCDERGERHFLHRNKCLHCLSLRQSRTVVPFVEVAAYHFLLRGTEFPQIEKLSPEDFDLFMKWGILK